MEMRKKYYYKFSIAFVVCLFIFLLVTINMGIFDLLRDDITILGTLESWFVIIIFGALSILMLLIIIQTWRKIGYVELVDKQIYIQNLLGKVKFAPVNSKYKTTKNKNGITSLILYDNNEKVLLIIGNGFDINLSEIQKIIDSNH